MLQIFFLKIEHISIAKFQDEAHILLYWISCDHDHLDQNSCNFSLIHFRFRVFTIICLLCKLNRDGKWVIANVELTLIVPHLIKRLFGLFIKIQNHGCKSTCKNSAHLNDNFMSSQNIQRKKLKILTLFSLYPYPWINDRFWFLISFTGLPLAWSHTVQTAASTKWEGNKWYYIRRTDFSIYRKKFRQNNQNNWNCEWKWFEHISFEMCLQNRTY